MADAPDHERLATLDQPELASIYAERMTHAAFDHRPTGNNNLTQLSIKGAGTETASRPDDKGGS